LEGYAEELGGVEWTELGGVWRFDCCVCVGRRRDENGVVDFHEWE
jgi:hypothetical protein